MYKTISHRLLILSTIVMLVYVIGSYTYIKHQYWSDNSLTPQYQSSLAEGINFSRAQLPSFVQSISGFSRIEPWGRWTNANAGLAKISFKEALPKKFILKLTAVSFGPNADSPTQIIVGGTIRDVVINRDVPGTYAITFDGIEGQREIEIRPPHPMSPDHINPANTDGRKLGIGLIEMKMIDQSSASS
jgi:phosphoglycerol transferase